MINEKAVSRAQQKFFGMVRARQKGEMQNASPEVEKAAASMKKSDVKKFASTKHKGLPDKKEVKEDKKPYGEERFCELCGKMEYREECSYGPKMWDMFTVKNFTEQITGWRKELPEAYLRIQERGRTYSIIFNWRGRTLKVQMVFNKFGRPSKDEVKAELNKVYPNPVVLYFNPTQKDPTLPLLFAGVENEPRRNSTR